MTTTATPFCQHVDCPHAATQHIAVPPIFAGLKEMVLPLCDKHAEDTLSDRLSFPGAHRVTVL